jgi:mono/diheme cytochrome c family protein
MNHRAVACLLTAVLLAAATACKTQRSVPSSADTDHAAVQISSEQTIQRCTALLPEDTSSAAPSSLSVRASGPIATFDDHRVSADQFHQFIRWFYDPDTHPAAANAPDQLARAAAWYYTVQRRLDDAGATARGSELLTLLKITKTQFPDDQHYRQYLTDVGLTELQLAVELCRTARFLDFARDQDSIDVTSQEVDQFLGRRNIDLSDSTAGERMRDRAALFLAFQQIGHLYPAANSPEWIQHHRNTELFPNRIVRQSSQSDAPPDIDDFPLTHEVIGGPSDWRFEYPQQMLRDDALPRRELHTWMLPADTNIELDASARDLTRTMYIPALGIRFFAPPKPKYHARHLLRFDAKAAAAGVDDNTLRLYPAIRPIYTRGLAHLTVHRYAIQSHTSPDDHLTHISLKPTTRPFEPGVTRSNFTLDVTTADAYDGLLTSMVSEPDGRDLYSNQCASCHGSRGEGTTPSYPKLAGADALNGEWPADDIIRTVLLGSDAPRLQQGDDDNREAMPPIDDNTTPRELTAIINFITSEWGNDGPRVTRDQVVRVSCATDDGFPTYRVPGTDRDAIPDKLNKAESSGSCAPDIRKRLQTQRKQARTSYTPPKDTYADQCATCHGDSGRGDGPAGQALHPGPTNFHNPDDWSHGRSPEAAFVAITRGLPGTAMSAYHNLSPQKRWALAIYTTRMLPSEAQTDSAQQPITRLCRRLTKRRTFYTDPCRPAP